MELFVRPPPTLPSSYLAAEIKPAHLKIGLKGGEQWFIDEATFGKVDTTESTWLVEGEGEARELNVVLVKASRGEIWDAALMGRIPGAVLDPVAKQAVQKELMLERFQEENPGFDFRNAEFNGAVPDAKTFMGGVKYD